MNTALEKPYLTCREVVDFMMDYLDGGLTAEERHEFDRHMAVCPSCVAFLKTYQETMRLGKAAFEDPDAPVGSEAPEDLIKAILAVRKKSP